MGSRRAASPRCHPGPALAGVPAQSTARFSIQLLRALPSLGCQDRCGHAPRASRGRKTVRRLCWPKMWRSSTGAPVRYVRRRSSSPCWGPPAKPLRRPPGHRNFPTGSARTHGASLFSAGHRKSWCRTICAAASPRHTATSRTSTPATVIWPSTTALPCCLLARVNPGIKPRLKSACKWLSAGSSRPCATASFLLGRTQHGHRRTT